MPVGWVESGFAAATVVGSAVAFVAGRRGRNASAAKDGADAAESLAGTVVQLGQRLDAVSAALWEAQARLVAAEQRAAAAELRAATADAELLRLRNEVAQLRAELARYEHGTTDRIL